MDLNKMVMDSLTRMQSEGKVQEMVDKHIASTVNHVINDCFGDWSDFSKQLKKEVEQKIQINLKELDIPSYNALVMSVIKEKLDDQIAAEGVARINESLDSILATAKSEYTLSEIVKELAGEVEKDDIGYDEYHEMTMHIDRSFSLSTIISLDADSGKDEYDCKYRFWVDTKTGKISNVSIRDDHHRSRREAHEFGARAIMRGFHGLEETLFKMYARGSRLVIDEDEVELEITRDDDH